MIRTRFFVAAFISLAVAGCRSLGPRTVSGDRFNYNEAGAQSTSEQLLLNIVRLRYGEPTYWLEITSMLSQYELKAGGALSWFDLTAEPLSSPALRAVYGLAPDPAVEKQQEANLGFVDRPTISYAPLQGKEFASRLMAPIPPATNEVAVAEHGVSDGRCSGIGYPPMNRLLFGYWTRENDDADPEP